MYNTPGRENRFKSPAIKARQHAGTGTAGGIQNAHPSSQTVASLGETRQSPARSGQRVVVPVVC